MKKTKAFYKVVVFAVSALLLSTVNAGAVSEEAQRHMDRGLAAVEMAKTPDDYERAISEFEKARSLAPDWVDVYYNLGLVQEKAGKLEESVQSLRTYLSLSPQAEDRKQVNKLIDQIEYRLERAKKDDARLAPLIGVWDRFDPATGEKMNAYTFTLNDGKITVSLNGAFGPIAVLVEFNGKNVSFKYVYKMHTVDTEYEVVGKMESLQSICGNLLSFVLRSNIAFIKVGKRGIVETELRKR